MLILPIDVIPGSSPPRFRWAERVQTPLGTTVVIDQEGSLQPSLEKAVVGLISLCRRMHERGSELQGTIDALNLQIEELRTAQASASEPTTSKPTNTSTGRRKG